MKPSRKRIGVCCLEVVLAAAMTGVGCGVGKCDPLVEACPIEDAGLHNPLFPGTALVAAGSPNLCVVNRTPTFTWEATGATLVFAGVFARNIRLERRSIGNTMDMVWGWHSGLGTAREGNVTYRDGAAVVDGEVVEDSQAPALAHERAYVWAIWAWDALGRRVSHSTPETFFTVDSAARETCISPLGGPSSVVVRARWIDGMGRPVAAANVGDTLRLQICSVGPLRMLTGALSTDSDTRLRLIDLSDLVSDRQVAVHPDCIAFVDQMEMASVSGPVFTTTASSAGIGPAGLIEVTVEATAPGPGTPLLSVLEAQLFTSVVADVAIDFALVEIR